MTDLLATGPAANDTGEPGPAAACTWEELHRACEEAGGIDAGNGLLLARSATLATVVGGPATSDGPLTGCLRPGGTLVRTPRGYVLDGEWPGVPGAETASRFGLVAQRDSIAGIGTEPVLVLVPRGAVHIGTNRPAGLLSVHPRTVSVTGLAVPENAVHDAFAPGTGHLLPVTARCAETSVLLGLARRALTEITRTARHRSRLGSVHRMAEEPLLQTELNRTVQDFRAARALFHTELARLPDSASGTTLTTARRVTFAAAALHTYQTAIETIRFSFGKAGGSALYNGHALQECWRDAETLAREFLVSPRAERAVAHAQLGGRPQPGLI
ncbi:acyl-CoA dehydrogenase family protein [Prauserella rugosa]|uniref:Acyl-CoA dehydrogenase-like protein n=1 Tax=Prauserella rugosa TaxID=43354 RepID=A0A660CGA6_9PSEU|nr:acyl-CoA dehydrogenase family protein [Prauserella rugosa]KMS87530.1 hypothetical protein ACZ91_30820 [Streptomyces regensis]TWH20703.1 acyl-CoA dehydrogenase-like protein [Prauserella rugosa]